MRAITRSPVKNYAATVRDDNMGPRARVIEKFHTALGKARSALSQPATYGKAQAPCCVAFDAGLLSHSNT
jgi:hypothetical protein